MEPCPDCGLTMYPVLETEMVSKMGRSLLTGTMLECVACGNMMLRVEGGGLESGIGDLAREVK